MDREHSALLERLKGQLPESDFSLLLDLLMDQMPYVPMLAATGCVLDLYGPDSWQARTIVRSLERYS